MKRNRMPRSDLFVWVFVSDSGKPEHDAMARNLEWHHIVIPNTGS